MQQVNNFYERSFLTDMVIRTTENDYLYLHQSSDNIGSGFLKFRNWNKKESIHKYNLSQKERAASYCERAVLKYGFSHGQKNGIVFMITGFSGERLINLLERVTAKVFVLEYYFNKETEFKDYLYEDAIENFFKEINL